MRRVRGMGVGVVVLLCARSALGDVVVNLDNGVPNGMYHLDVDVDDYGSFGREVSPNADDSYWPFGVNKVQAATFMSTSFLFVTQPITGSIVLSMHPKIQQHFEPQGDGVVGPATLTRMVTMPTTKTAQTAHSEIRIADAPSNLQLKIVVDQRLVPGATTSRLEQDYAITNTGTAAATLVFHNFWDMDLYYGDLDVASDVVGAGTGLCYVYQHDPAYSSQGGSLADGASTVTTRYYYAGKEGFAPNGGPQYSTSDSPTHPEWTAMGMPTEWRNNVAYWGTNIPGETTMSGDAMIAMEWRFTLAPGATETLKPRRIYGTDTVPCNVSASCGNMVVDGTDACDTGVDTMDCDALDCTQPACGDHYLNNAVEECESLSGVDTADCDAATCTRPVCGDGHWNTAAEACDDGADTANCNLANCQPPMCGDGVVNLAVEDCEGGELCTTDCRYTYSVGGGCGGCSSADPPWFLALLLLVRRRRRYGAI